MNRRQTIALGLIVVGLIALALGGLRSMGGDENAAPSNIGAVAGPPVRIEKGQSETFGGQRVTLVEVVPGSDGGLIAALQLGEFNGAKASETKAAIAETFSTAAGSFTVTGLTRDGESAQAIELSFAPK